MKVRFAVLLTFVFAFFFCLQIPTWIFLVTASAKESLVVHMPLSAGSGLFLAYLTTIQLRKNGSRILGFGERNTLPRFAGIALAGLLPFFLILLPNINRLGPKSFNAAAESAGRNAGIAENRFFQQQQETAGSGRYTSNLDELLALDKNLTDDPLITFQFIRADSSGFAFRTEKPCGPKCKKYHWNSQTQRLK